MCDMVSFGVKKRSEPTVHSNSIVRDESGFSLAESMVALLIVAILALALSAMFFRSNYFTSQASVEQRAIYQAQQKLEEIKAKTFKEVVPEKVDNPSILADPSMKFPYEVKVKTYEGMRDLKTVTVEVKYTISGSERIVSLATDILRR